MRLRTSVLAAVVLAAGSAWVWAGISVAPAFVEVTLDKGRPAGRFEIANLGEKVERYRVRALHFRFAADGSLLRLKADERSLAPWVKFNPAELTVAPKTSRAVRFVIIPRGKLAPGEYWGAMELENLDTQVGKGKDKEGRELKIEVVSTVLVPIFGTVGTVSRQGSLDHVKAAPDEEGTLIQARVTNQGTGRLLVKGRYEIQNASGEVLEEEELGYAYILPQADRKFSRRVKVGLPKGDYTVSVKYESPQLAQPLTGEATLTLASPSVPPPPKADESARARSPAAASPTS
ncbi:MAG TPA: hypothetical protein VM238_10325 [Phycisphaerae bacterium]|nr:hypothetical protein [Phycisphaerae bacterium]